LEVRLIVVVGAELISVFLLSYAPIALMVAMFVCVEF
jgi:phosphate starvation-inducible membrane PsiE